MIVDPQDPEATGDALRSFIAVGATQLVLAVRAPYAPGQVRWLSDEVIAPVARER